MTYLALRCALFAVFYAPTHVFATPAPIPPPCKHFYETASLASLKAFVIEESQTDEAWRCSGSYLQSIGVAGMPVWISLLDQPDQKVQEFALNSIAQLISDRYQSNQRDVRVNLLARKSLTADEANKILFKGIKLGNYYLEQCDFLKAPFPDDLGRDSVAGLMSMLQPRDLLAANAASCLGNIGRVARPAIPQLLKLLNARDAVMKLSYEKDNFDFQAWQAIAKIGLDTPAQFELLLDKFDVKYVDSYNNYKRTVLLGFDPLPAALVPRFIKELNKVDFKSNHYRDVDQAYVWSQLLGFTHAVQAAPTLLEHKAYEAMASLGPAAVPFLSKQMTNVKGPEEGDDIANALLYIATPEARQVALAHIQKQVPTLLGGLKGEFGDYRRFKILKRNASLAMTPLSLMLNDADIEVRRRAFSALKEIGAEGLEIDDKEQNKGNFGKPKDYRLRDLDFPMNESFEKLYALGLIGSEQALYALTARGESSIPVLLKLIENKAISKNAGSDAIPRDRAIDALLSMGEHGEGAWPRLIADLDDDRFAFELASDSNPRLAYLGRRNNRVIELLFAHMINSKDGGGRWYAASVLGALLSRPPAMPVPQHMVYVLQEKRKDRNARSALRQYGGDLPLNMVRALNRGIHDKDKKFRYADDTQKQFDDLHANRGNARACLQLKSYDGKTSLPPDAACFLREIFLYWHYFPEQRPAAIDTITRLLRDKDPKNRQMASDLLGSLGRYSSSALPELSRLLKDDVVLIRHVAADNLVRLARRGVLAPDLIPYLLERIDGDDGSQAYLAATGLSNLETIPAKHAEALVRLIKKAKFPGNYEYLIIALGNTKSVVGVKALLNQQNANLSLNQMRRVGIALQKAGTIAEPLIASALLRSKKRDIRIVLAKALTQSTVEKYRKIADAEFQKILLVLLSDLEKTDTLEAWNVDIRQKAAQDIALLYENFPQARSQLLTMMRNTDPSIREIALQALSDIPSEEVRMGFRQASLDKNTKVATLAAFHLNQKMKIPENRYIRQSRCSESVVNELAIDLHCEKN